MPPAAVVARLARGRTPPCYPDGVTLLGRYVELHNRGVAGGGFAPLVSLFAADAVVSFEGLPIGPFVGRDAIAAAFSARPPDDALCLVDSASVEAPHGRYAWRARPLAVAGR